MVWTGRVAGSHAPGHLAKDQHKDQEEDAGDFKEDDAAYTRKWLEKSRKASREVA